ncbi:MAG TPA: HEAT repeat domain-containing protein [Arenibaculum sp.]|nr:HEAT repeat domain-containing protein [Arenibaculum sp.]
MSRRKHPDQFDLFAVRPENPAAQPGPPPVETRPRRALGDLPADALIDLLNLHLVGKPPTVPLAGLADELGRRREQRAVMPLLRVCRLFAGHDRDREAPAAELRAALDALAAIGAADAGPPLVDMVEADAFGTAGTAAALACLAALRSRTAAGLIGRLAASPEPTIRRAVCVLAGALARPEELDAIMALATDPDRRVARAACLTLGRLGHRPVKPELEELLVRAAPMDLAAVAQALVPVADDDTAVVLGRVAERSDEAGRLAIVEALGALDLPEAAVWLVRLARDRKPSVRLGVVGALAHREGDDKIAQALGSLAGDADPEVRSAAEEALKAFDAGW